MKLNGKRELWQFAALVGAATLASALKHHLLKDSMLLPVLPELKSVAPMDAELKILLAKNAAFKCSGLYFAWNADKWSNGGEIKRMLLYGAGLGLYL